MVVCTSSVHAADGSRDVADPIAATGQLPRVEITGSLLRRPDGDVGAPITVLRAVELRQRGVTTLAQALTYVAANQSRVDVADSVGNLNGGKAEVDLRGLGVTLGSGSARTLVLLDGRRLVNHPYDGASVDVHAIPLAAVDRIEVLRDGASAVYGADAIGGVVNVVLRREVDANEIAAEAQGSTLGGGLVRRFSLVSGSSDDTGWRWMHALDLRDQQRLPAHRRAASRTGVLLGDTDRLTSYYGHPGSINGYDPAAPTCAQPNSVLGSQGLCRYDIAATVDAIPANQQRLALLRVERDLGTGWALSADHVWSRHQVVANSGAASVDLFMPAGTPFFPNVPPGVVQDVPDLYGPDPTLQVPGGLVSWRELAAGPRIRSATTLSGRTLLGLRGELSGGWSLETAVGRARSSSVERVRSGFVDDNLMQQGVWDGLINPFGPQTLAGQQAIEAAQVRAVVQSGRATQDVVDLKLRGDLMQTSLGPVPAAFGLEHRRERSAFQVADGVSSLSSLGLDAGADTEGGRRIDAFHTELLWPLAERMDLTTAFRVDRYDDIGTALSPKVALRWRPTPTWTLRGSYGTGFRPPTLYDLHRPSALGYTADVRDDPLLCPGGTAINGLSTADQALACGVQFRVRSSGPAANGQPLSSLAPERSRQFTLGSHWLPIPTLSVALDVWQIHVRQAIGALADGAVFDDPSRYGARIVRCSQLPIGPGEGLRRDDFPACLSGTADTIAYVDLPTQNLGALRTHGLDLGLQWLISRGPSGRWSVRLDGTRVLSHRYQRETGGAWREAVGVYGDDGPVLRWQHVATLSWQRGDWLVSGSQRYRSGYQDQLAMRRVVADITHDLGVQWRVSETWLTTFTVRNLFDRDPPLSLQTRSFQAGYDPRLADPTGRVFGLQVSASF
ncbi:iron complex outermembrane receptor protein [Sphaerotilus mobilis]|uniref:Iron complex outermembrane receptor protein n=1 Tax=Sphaerotilus mobilis TaxID=47994 RepID=A0A4Q7LQZ7_9BURK|nr:iron complex outermembrane receptor protein [Sphaerotilus mobilis]